MAGEFLLVGYVLAFGAAAVACFASVSRVGRLDDRDTRRGLVALLVTSGGWAAAHVGFLLVPTPELKTAFYLAGLIVGFATVGPWLYFCSAYTGRSLHRDATVRRAAIAVFAAVTLLKLTNPLHHLYFTTDLLTTPFPHLAVQSGVIHWLVMGLSYALAAVGYFMLLELFWQVGHDTTPLAALVGLTGLPILLDVLGLVSPLLINITYEPLGVAAFAVGLFYVFFEDFRTIQLAGEADDPIIVLDDDDRVRDFNAEARELFPELETGTTLEAVVPTVLTSLEEGEAVVEMDRAGGMRYYQVTSHPFTADRSKLGQAITLTDVTERERYRQELERQNERLEQFASMISHDLRNPLNVAEGRIDLARREADSEHLETASAALERMETLIEDLLSLARQGQPIDETEEVTLSAIAEDCWEMVETGGASLVVGADLTFMADPDRLQQLLENLFRNAVEHGGEGVTISVGALEERSGFYVADDGPGIPESARDSVFESGYTTEEAGTGFGLAIVEEIVEAHGWTIELAQSDAGGARFDIVSVETAA